MVEKRLETDDIWSMPVFIADNSYGIVSYDSYMELLNQYEFLPDGTLYDEVPFVELMDIAEQVLSQTGDDYAIDHSVSDRLCDILRAMNIADWSLLWKAIGTSIDSGISMDDLSDITKDNINIFLKLPVTKEEMFALFKDMKMDSYTAFRFVSDLSCGKGLSDDMRDELWMDFSPEWLTLYCEKIRYLPSENELEAQMKMLMTIVWFKIGKKDQFGERKQLV